MAVSTVRPAISDVACTLKPRASAELFAFTEILHTWREDGAERFALSRVNYAIADSAHARAYQNQQFIQRRKR